ncbi:hypothetical protein ACOSQ3_002754 [Xanthoceras sorbifolium]
MAIRRLIINYNGQWDGLKYVGGEPFVQVVTDDLTYAQLLDLIYGLIGVDRSLHDVVVSSVVSNDMNERRKYIIRRDEDVYFLLVCDRAVHEIYVGIVEKVDNHVRYSPQIPAPIPGWSTKIPDALRPPSFGTNFAGAGTSNFTPSTDVPLWEGDHGIPPSFADDYEQSDNVTHSDSSDDDGILLPPTSCHTPEHLSDEDCQGMEQPDNQQAGGVVPPYYPVVDAVQSRWVIPGADQYCIEPIRSETSNSLRGALYTGKIFQTKDHLKVALGKYAMMQKFNHRIRWSTKRRFEAGCRDINCKFVLRAIRKENCSVWHVRKFNTVHSCSLDAYESHFRSVSAVVIGEIFAPKLNTNGRVIRPVDIISEMREQHGVQLCTPRPGGQKNMRRKFFTVNLRIHTVY